MIRLLIVDDHPVVQSALAARYGARDDVSVVASVATVKDAVARVSSGVVDVAVVDVQLDATLTPRQLASLTAHARVVLFTARASEPAVRQLAAGGAVVVVDKGAPLDALDAAVLGSAKTQEQQKAQTKKTESLTARELEVYRALVRCRTPKEVAADLGIAVSTVYCHIDRLRQKLGVETLPELVAQALSDLAPLD